jgi:hypothetical protein
VNVSTDLNITGKPAQFGRSVVAEVSERLIGQFADNLARELEAGQSVPAGDSLDLLKIAGGPVARRLAPVLATLAAVSVFAIVRRVLRSRSLCPPRGMPTSRSGSTSGLACCPRWGSGSSTSWAWRALRLPVVQAPFAGIFAALLVIGHQTGLGTAFGSLIVASLIWTVLSVPLRRWSVVARLSARISQPVGTRSSGAAPCCGASSPRRSSTRCSRRPRGAT